MKVKNNIRARSASVQVNSFNVEDNTVDVVFATEAHVLRFDEARRQHFIEVLGISHSEIDMSRMESGAPVLNNHKNEEGLDKVIGVVVSVWIDEERKEACAKVRLSTEPEDKSIVSKIKNGIIRNVSVGYDVFEYTDTGTTDQNNVPIWRATSWQPMELSFVPVPADHRSRVRKKQNIFKPTNQVEMKKRQQQASEIVVSDADNNQYILTPVPKEAAIDSETTEEVEEIVDDLTDTVDELSDVVDDLVDTVEEIEEDIEEEDDSEDSASSTTDERKTAIKKERKRVSEIMRACRSAQMSQTFAQRMVESGASVNKTRAAIIKAIAKKATPAPTNQGIRIGMDETDHIRNAAVDGIMDRIKPGSVRNIGQNPKAQQYRQMRLFDIAKERLRSSGVNVQIMSHKEIVQRAVATTDYPMLLSDAVERTLRRDYEAQPQPWEMIARRESADDFRIKTGVKIDGKATFAEIPEGSEYQSVPIIQDEDATLKLKRFGQSHPITYEAIINDDLNVFSRIPRIIGIGAQDFQSDKIWGLIANNALTPDGTAIFHATHGNLAAVGAVPDIVTLSAGRTALRRMKSPAGNNIGVAPKFLIVPPELETVAQQLIGNIDPTRYTSVNPFEGSLQVVVCNKLTNTGAWYLAADPNEITADGIVYAYLDGHEGVTIDNYIDPKTDALVIKASLAFDATLWGYQGWYKNPGA